MSVTLLASAGAKLTWTYGEHSYGYFEMAKTWDAANTFAKAIQGGHLVKVDDLSENAKIYEKVAPVFSGKSVAIDGGSASYVWLGASDNASEGTWKWSSDNSALAVSREEWGSGMTGWGSVTEPDNSQGKQNYLGMAFTMWPNPSWNMGNIGDPGEWNDLIGSNKLFFVVEIDSVEVAGSIATAFADTLNAPSDDPWTINGLAGNDTITGGAGDDSLNGGAGNDTLTGGAGNDAYFVDAAGDVIIELESDNTPEQQKFSMGNYNDVVIASVSYALNTNAAVEDIMAAGTLTGSSKNTAINLTSNDLGQGLIGNEAKNILTGKNGDDVLVGMGGDDTLNGGAGTDILVGGAGKDIMNGGAGDDGFLFNIGSADGTDFLFNSGSIFLTGGSDTIDGGDGDGDTIVLMGTLADYTLSKTSATVYKIVAKQILYGATAVETASFNNIEYLGFISTLADLDNDIVTQVALSSIPIATAFADTLNAPSDDPWTINGLAGNDTITGGAGDDTIDGGLGNDILTGGIGADSFKFTSALKGNIDSITDFTRGSDKLVLDDAIFAKLVGQSGQLSNAGYFKGGANSVAADSNDYLIFNTSSGALFYDADGNGTKVAAIQFATLVGVTDLAASDFLII